MASKTNRFIEKAKKKHNSKYSYEKAHYVNSKCKVLITCALHGDFWQIPSSHLSGCGCQGCNKEGISKRNRLSTEDFKEIAAKVHGGKYDYSLVEYKLSTSRVKIICPAHGEFSQTANSHLQGHGCAKCAVEQTSLRRSATLLDFLTRAQHAHADKYNYDLIYEFGGYNTKVQIICPIHGTFSQKAIHHVDGFGCELCGFEQSTEKNRKTLEEFLAQAKSIHGDRYDYSLVEYKNSNTKVEIICKEHGAFWQSASSHTSGRGCPSCKESGFDITKQGWLYVLQCGDITKIGITNRDVELRVIEISRSYGAEFMPINKFYFHNGRDCLNIEGRVLKYLRSLYKNPSSKFDGYTECFLNVDRQSLYNKIEELIDE